LTPGGAGRSEKSVMLLPLRFSFDDEGGGATAGSAFLGPHPAINNGESRTPRINRRLAAEVVVIEIPQITIFVDDLSAPATVESIWNSRRVGGSGS
jgi:hypothetical protein